MLHLSLHTLCPVSHIVVVVQVAEDLPTGLLLLPQSLLQFPLTPLQSLHLPLQLLLHRLHLGLGMMSQ